MLTLGTPVPWDLCTADGKVMFRKGFVCNTEDSLARIGQLELFFDIPQPAPGAVPGADEDTAPPAPGPFGAIDNLADQLDACFMEVIQSIQPAAQRVVEMAAAVRQLYAEHTSPCLAAIHFRHNKPSSSLHPIYSMFLIELLAPALMLGRESHIRLSQAALTANLGMYEFQDQWANQAGPLSDEQKLQVRRHPEVSVERLKTLSIDDPIWFAIVRQHHERADGSGYPMGLSGSKVLREALILGMLDRYLAFVMPRANRKWTHPTAALKIIYEDAAAYGTEHIKTFIQQLGVYPPGTSVRLANGEIAVVVNHEIGKSARPLVMSIGRSASEPFEQAVERDTAKPEYKLKGLYLPDPEREANPATLVPSWD